jgi:tetratricopeptide (TPR) repeat protein
VKVEPPNPKYGVIIAVRKAAIGAWKGEYAEAIDSLKAAMTAYPGLDLTSDIHKIVLRRESNTLKAPADTLYRQGSLSDAKMQYQTALQIDPSNEIILSNLSQIALKEGDFPLVLDYCAKALPFAVLNQRLRVKLLVRQAKAYRGSGELEQGRKAVEQALAEEPDNRNVLRLGQEIQEETDKEKYAGLKKEADNALRSGNPALALQLYRDLLLSTRDREARAALYTNLCACHLLQKQYLDVVSTAERGLQLNPSTALKLRLLSRRANAFSALGQVHSAILDLRKALDLDPENPALTQELALLTQSRT